MTGDHLTNPITLDEAIAIRDSGYLTPLEARLSQALVKAMRQLCPSEYSGAEVNDAKP